MGHPIRAKHLQMVEVDTDLYEEFGIVASPSEMDTINRSLADRRIVVITLQASSVWGGKQLTLNVRFTAVGTERASLDSLVNFRATVYRVVETPTGLSPRSMGQITGTLSFVDRNGWVIIPKALVPELAKFQNVNISAQGRSIHVG